MFENEIDRKCTDPTVELLLLVISEMTVSRQVSREDSSSMSMLKHPDSPDSSEGGSSGATAAAATCRTVSPRRFRMSKRALVSTGILSFS